MPRVAGGMRMRPEWAREAMNSSFIHPSGKQSISNNNRRRLVGGEDFQQLMGSPEIHNVLNFSAPIGWGREIYGLKVEVIPWMRGMVVLP